MNRQTLNWIGAVAIMLLLAILLSNQYHEAVAAPAEITSANSPQWNGSPPGLMISDNSGVGANEPALAVAPNGDMMVVYNNWMTSSTDRDPYFSVSTNGGVNWTTPAPIFSSPGINSIQVDVAYDANGVAHVVWVELVDAIPPTQTTSLFYSRRTGGNWTAPTTLSSVTSFLPLIGHPRLVTGSGFLDVVWEEGSPTIFEQGGNTSIMHTRSSNNGTSWSGNSQVSDIFLTSTAQTASIDIDPTSGVPLVVWRQALPAGDAEIRYAEATVGAGNTVSWAPSINVSSIVSNTNQPEVLLKNGRIHVSFTQSLVVGNNAFNQWVYYTFCNSNCLNTASWSPPFNTLVDPVEVNDNSPFDVISDIVQGENGCNYIFFHGLRDDTFDRELVWNVNSCDGWNPPEGWDPVTTDDTRAINPRVTVYGSNIYLVFQLVTDGGSNEIYFMSGTTGGPTGVFLPAVYKP